ncbi:DUF1414 domain-containing protein [Aliidiomarina haloalkalitolerans]|uniref:Uncharacterized protein n=1 Tax=Aliidiomarina haloalkalitolerans TaxID=859059 RepID=A0A432VY82_9GAMM|nr:DUF1414 domain-containing protein [Aliidiomarina haloalkalitolerans]MCL4409823.1 DUF1414 domain-containing protein [Gammaproteobacteria bacterium]RUO21606.1 hypothetical protein CWE06_01760 [Aliidiomarina haloalkalitolerans]
MPILSKYDEERQEKLINEILDLFANDSSPSDLALMTLGNVTTHIIHNHVAADKREAVARQFGQILLQSIANSSQS